MTIPDRMALLQSQEEPEIPPGQARALYQALWEKLGAAEPLTESEMTTLAYGMTHQQQVGWKPDVPIDSAVARLREAEKSNPGMTQVDEFTEALNTSQAIQPDAVAQAIIDSVVTLGFGTAAGLARGGLGAAGAVRAGAANPNLYGTPTAGAAFRSGFAGGLASPAKMPGQAVGALKGVPRLTAGGVKSAVNLWKNHKIVGTAGGIGIYAAGADMLRGEGGEGEVDPKTGKPMPPPVQRLLAGIDPNPNDPTASSPTRDDDFLIVDPATGETTTVGNALGGTTAAQGTGAEMSPDLAALLVGMGIDPAAVASGINTGPEFVAPNPQNLGDFQVDPGTAPFGVSFGGQPVTEQEGKAGGFLVDPHPTVPDAVRQAEQDPNLNPDRDPGIAPGGTIVSRAFSKFQGKTLLQHTVEAAAAYGVPANLLYGMIVQESGYNPNAVGDGGNSHGLVQIYRVAHPNVSVAQARNPAFATRWAARNLLQHFNRFGTWEAAVMAHRSPAGAAHFVKTGRFREALDKTYTGNVMNNAVRSGIGNEIYGSDEFLSAITGDEPGSGATGPTVPPFQAPDEDTLKEFARVSVQELLGRDVIGDEMESFVDQLTGLYRGSYDAQVGELLGRKTTEVDPGASFREDIRASGEGQFHKDVTTQRKFSEFVGSMAGIIGSI